MAYALRTENNVFLINNIDAPTPTVVPEVTHHIFVVDRSGSMWGDIDGLKSSIEQVLAVESLLNGTVNTSLISFSSHKDVTLHWSAVPAEKVTELSGPYLKELRSIRATYLTGISQGLNLALDQVKEGQTTGITLFTDGYANDPSSFQENKSLDAFVEKVKAEFPNVFVNTIGFRDWCDWPRMEAIANTLSGKCVKAKSFKAVLEAMKDTQTLLAGNVRPALKVAGEANTNIVAVNRTTGQVNATALGADLILRGVSSEDKVEVYRVSKMEKESTVPTGTKVVSPYVLSKGESVEDTDLSVYGVMARAFSGVGELRTAKELLFSSGNKTLWNEHQSAMTPSSLAAMNEDLTSWVKAGSNDGYEMGRNIRPPHNLFDLAKTINSLPPKSIGIDSESFYKNYRRRSVKSLSGTRNPDGSITPPNASLVARDGARVYVKGLSFNTSDASVQMETEIAVWVKRSSDDQVFQEVNFVSLDGLRDYRSYTLISSGERNVEILPLEVYTKAAWEQLSPFVLPSEAREFTPGQKAKIMLKKFRMETDAAPTVDQLREALDSRMRAVAQVKIFSAMQNKVEASPFTAEQVEALKALHLSPALYFSAPSTVHYTDKDEAIRKGQIDSFTRYKVNFGIPEILDTGAFRSGNAFLDRRYAVTLNGAAVAKPKLDTYLQGATYLVKPPNPKAKDTAADVIMAEAADKVLLASGRISNAQITENLVNAQKAVSEANDVFQGLVMEVGCTGLLPAELEKVSTRYDAEAFAAKFGVKLGKDEQEGMYYVLPNDLVVSITPETSWYTVTTEEPTEQIAAK
jgi:hypothetical protein